MEGAFQTIGEAAEAQGSQDAEEGIERREDGIITAVSYCVHCEEDGLTTFLPTVIPHFKRVIVSAFSCPHCSYRNSELQLADYEDKGCQYTLQVEGAESLNRQVVKSNKATLRIPELEFEIPATAESKALISTLEGLLVQHIDNLESDQPVRRALEPDNADKIDAFLAKLKKCANAEMPFTFVLRDPSGNSFVENPLAPATDPKLQAAFFTRSMDENEVLGITHDADAAAPRIEDEFEYGVGTEDLAQFNEMCYACGSEGSLKMKLTNIPHFKEIILMCFTCESCGYKSVDVKPGGEICEHGVEFRLQVQDARIDLSRDVIKSADAYVCIPEIELELAAGTLGGLFTTVEGLLSQARDHLTKSNPLAFTMGDAASSPSSLYQAFVKRLDACIGGTEQFTFVLRDPTGNSYVQALDESDEGWGVTDQAKRGVQRGMQAPTESGVDPRLTRAYFTRTLEEEDELGLADMRTDLGEDGDWKAPASLERSAKERRDALEKAQGGNMVACGPSRARVSHLLVEDETACVELKRQLDERGVGAFSELAASQSICPSAKQSGLLGSFSPGKMVAAFDAVVFSASVGEVHGPVHTQFGYHLILIHERHDGDDAASATLRPSD